MTAPFILMTLACAIMAITISLQWRCIKRQEKIISDKDKYNFSPPPAPEGMFHTRPLLTDWLHNGCGEYFRRGAVAALTQNPNKTMNVVLGNGHTINTGLEIDDLKEVLGFGFSCSVDEELAHRKKMHKF